MIDDLSFSLPRNGIVGVIGPNGAGKTTLFKTILGMEKPDSGNVKVGETVSISYVDPGRVAGFRRLFLCQPAVVLRDCLGSSGDLAFSGREDGLAGVS